MYKFNTIMIALDLTKMDETILSYSAKMCEIIKPKKVYFINIQKNLDLDDEMKAMIMGNDEQPMDEFVAAKMKEEVKNFFDLDTSFEREYEVVEGNPSNEILRWVKMKDADLLVMGRKKELTGSGMMPQQIASKVKSSVLMVPEGTVKFSLDHIFVPVDFSDYSVSALEEAYEIDKDHKADVEVTTVHFFELPMGYEKSGKSSEEFAAIMEKNAMKKFHKFKEKLGAVGAAIEPKCKLVNDDSSIAEEINNEAHKVGADMIIVGAKGRTLATQLFLGSVTQKLIKHDSDTPLLVVKDKKATFDFWDFFKSV